jgi:hypothetical protein
MLTSIGRILNGSPTPAGRAPVRRGSHLAGRHEATFWRATDRQEVRRIILAARRYELAERSAGAGTARSGTWPSRCSSFWPPGQLQDRPAGAVAGVPHAEAQALQGRRRRALQALRAHGFLDWLRRYVPTGQEGRGPQVKQTSNAYRLSMPARAMRLLGRLCRGHPSRTT